jgi:hypothetical protein
VALPNCKRRGGNGRLEGGLLGFINVFSLTVMANTPFRVVSDDLVTCQPRSHMETKRLASLPVPFPANRWNDPMIARLK